jgi:hypothetical protein
MMIQVENRFDDDFILLPSEQQRLYRRQGCRKFHVHHAALYRPDPADAWGLPIPVVSPVNTIGHGPSDRQGLPGNGPKHILESSPIDCNRPNLFARMNRKDSQAWQGPGKQLELNYPAGNRCRSRIFGGFPLPVGAPSSRECHL